MSKPYRLSTLAESDLLEIWKYLDREVSADVADKIVSKIRSGMDRLGRSPGVGHQRKDLTHLQVRFFQVRPYLIIYAPLEKPIGIVRILHAARDIPSILRGG